MHVGLAGSVAVLIQMWPVFAEPCKRAGAVLPVHYEVTAGVHNFHTCLCCPGRRHQHQVPRDWRAVAAPCRLAGKLLVTVTEFQLHFDLSTLPQYEVLLWLSSSTPSSQR